MFRDNDYDGNCLLKENTRRKITIIEYVYDLRDGSTFSDKQISMITNAIRNTTDSFTNPLNDVKCEAQIIRGTYIAMNTVSDKNGDIAADKYGQGMDFSIEESKSHKNMKRTITESQLRQIIAEAIKNSLGYPLNVHPYEVEDANEILEKINYLLHHSGRNRKRPVLTGILERFRDEIRREVLKMPTFYDDTSSNDDEVQPWEQDELDYIYGKGAYRSDY